MYVDVVQEGQLFVWDSKLKQKDCPFNIYFICLLVKKRDTPLLRNKEFLCGKYKFSFKILLIFRESDEEG